MNRGDLQHKFDRVKEHLIGIWRFRATRRKPLWCATFEFDGYYYDVEGYKDIEDTLNSVHKKISSLKLRKNRTRKEKKA